MENKDKANIISMTDADNEKPTIEDRVLIKELEEKIEGMKADKERKCKSAKEQLVNMLEVTVDKYRTATGTAEALRVLRFTYGDEDMLLVGLACELASEMAFEADKMKKKAEELSYAKMDQLCDGFYEKEFSSDSPYKLAFEMMKIDLCRNVGGAAEDMVEFIRHTEAEIDKVGEQLKELRAKEKKD